MANFKPEIVPINELDENNLPFSPGIDDSSGFVIDTGPRSLFKDGRALIDKAKILEFLKSTKLGARAIETVVDRFANLSEHPNRTIDIANDFINTRLGYKVQDLDADILPLSVQHGIQTNLSEQPLSVIYFSPVTCDQLAVMFLGNMVIYTPEDIEDVASLVIASYIEAGYTMALYEYFANIRWADGDGSLNNFKKYSRAAKRIVNDLIGHNEFMGEDPMLSTRIAGGVAFRRLFDTLSQSEALEDPNRLRYIERMRGSLCLSALRASDDDLFLGIASSIGKELEDAHIKAAVDVGFPKSVD